MPNLSLACRNSIAAFNIAALSFCLLLLLLSGQTKKLTFGHFIIFLPSTLFDAKNSRRYLTVLKGTRRYFTLLHDSQRYSTHFSTLFDAARRCSTLLNAAQRSSTLLDVVRRCSTLLNAT
jgi:hypothetical protein